MFAASRAPGARDVAAVHARSALETSPAVLRRKFADAFKPRPWIYWIDMLGSAVVGWAAFALSLAQHGVASALALAVATLALYRAVLFIHELAHLRPGAIPGFETVWNLLVGMPLLGPSIMYVGSHSDHHKRSVYGTADDPEYEAIAYWSPLRIVASTMTMPLLPAALALRWGVLGPLSRAVPPLRRFVVQSLSTLVINPSYKRKAGRGRMALRWAACEAGAALYVWAAVLGVASGQVPVAWVGRWYALVSGILVVNHVRTLAAHRYENRGARLDVTGQVVDSVNLRGIPGFTALLAPVGLRYHALHHLMPALPYHSLGSVHRRLLAELPPDSPYRITEERSLASALSDLMARAARNGRPDAVAHGTTVAAVRVAVAPEAGRRTPVTSDAGAATL